jgi:hypothetical protein
MKNTVIIYTGLLVSTYIVNAIIAPLYANNCTTIGNYNSPICSTGLSILTGAAGLNYWIYYFALTSFGLFIMSKTIGRGK